MKNEHRVSSSVATLTLLAVLTPAMAQGQLSLVRWWNWIAPGTEEAEFGSAVLAIDLNGDGIDDVAAATPFASGAGVDRGRLDLRHTLSDSTMPPAGVIEQCLDEMDQGDHYELGRTLAAGDFDGDGDKDLAIGMPGAAVDGTLHAGAVCVLYHGVGGNIVLRQRIAQGSFVGDTPEIGDRFGGALAAGDLNGDGIDDLAIGAYNENYGAVEDAGVVHVVFGSPSGLSDTGDVIVERGTAGTWSLAVEEQFGFALAIGDFHGDSTRQELAVAAPGDHPDSPGGSVTVVRVDPGVQFERHYTEALTGSGSIKGSVSAATRFGAALAAGDFDGDGDKDLAIGVPRESDWGPFGTVGVVWILYRGATELDDVGAQFITEDLVGGGADTDDQLGHVLAAGDFNGDGRSDLAMGIPLDDPSGFENAGRVVFIYGSDAGLEPANYAALNMSLFGGLEAGDHFGRALATGKLFEPHGGDDLIIGVTRRKKILFEGLAEPRTGRVVVVQSALTFADGFESGDTSAWATP